MRVKATKNTLIALGGGLLLVALLFGGLWHVQSSAVGKLRAELERKQKDLEDGQKTARREAEVLEALARDEEQIRFLESGVPEAAFVPTMLAQIEGLARETRNTVLGIRPVVVKETATKLEKRRDPEAQTKDGKKDPKAGDKKAEAKKPDPYTRLTIEVSLVGSFASSEAFIARLTQFPKIVSVEEVNVSPFTARGAKQEASAATLTTQIKLMAFIMKEPTPATQKGGATVRASADLGGMP